MDPRLKPPGYWFRFYPTKLSIKICFNPWNHLPFHFADGNRELRISNPASRVRVVGDGHFGYEYQFPLRGKGWLEVQIMLRISIPASGKRMVGGPNHATNMNPSSMEIELFSTKQKIRDNPPDPFHPCSIIPCPQRNSV